MYKIIDRRLEKHQFTLKEDIEKLKNLIIIIIYTQIRAA
jgi:hypothetical protein